MKYPLIIGELSLTKTFEHILSISVQSEFSKINIIMKNQKSIKKI